MTDGAPEPFAHPVGWTPSQSATMRLTRREEIERGLLPLAREGGMEVLLEYGTGREVYVRRTSRRPPV